MDFTGIRVTWILSNADVCGAFIDTTSYPIIVSENWLLLISLQTLKTKYS